MSSSGEKASEVHIISYAHLSPRTCFGLTWLCKLCAFRQQRVSFHSVSQTRLLEAPTTHAPLKITGIVVLEM